MTATPTSSTKSPKKSLDRSCLPLVIAVAGHRDPIASEVPRLREAFRNDLQALMKELPVTPLVMLNGLACGMDSEAAEIFLDLVAEQRELNPIIPDHKLIAALPKRKENYRNDFTIGPERERFEKLLSNCHVVLDPSNCANLRDEKNPDVDLPSPDCYGKQGMFLVRHCFFLFAFYNGYETLEVGGTSQSVAMQKGEVHSMFLNVDEVLATREPSALIEYDTPRQKNSDSSHHRSSDKYWIGTDQKKTLRDLLEIPRKLEAINKEVANPSLTLLQWAPLRTAMWAYVDGKASSSKRFYLIWGLTLLLSGWLISISLVEPPWQSLGLLMIFVALVVFPSSKSGPKQSFIEYRCLAEALTVQDFWIDLGVQVDAADLFHTQLHLELGWIRTVLRARKIHLMTRQDNKLPPIQTTTLATETWITNQVSWLNQRIIEQKLLDRLLNRLIQGSLIATLTLSLLAITPVLRTPLMWFTEGGIATFVALLACRQLLGYEETNARYERSRDQFSRGLKAIEKAKSTSSDNSQKIQRLRCAFEAVGREKLDELNDWVADQLKRSYNPGG